MLYKWNISGSHEAQLSAKGDKEAIDLMRKSISKNLSSRRSVYIEEIIIYPDGESFTTEFNSAKEFKEHGFS
jgi:hypothetical protein